MEIKPEKPNQLQVKFKGSELVEAQRSELLKKAVAASILESLKKPSTVWFIMGCILLALESRIGDSIAILGILLTRILFDYFIDYNPPRNSCCRVWTGISFQEMQSSKLRTGDLVLLEQNQKSPCKLVALSSLTPSIEVLKTPNKLVFRSPVKETQELLTPISFQELVFFIQALSFQVSFEDKDLSKGKLKLENSPRSTELLKSNFINKGSVLVSGWVVGLVVGDLSVRKSSSYFKKSVMKLGWMLIVFSALTIGVLALYEALAEDRRADLVFYYLYSLVLVPLPLLILLDVLRFLFSRKFQKRFPDITFNKKLLNEDLAKAEYCVVAKSTLLRNEDSKPSYFSTPSSCYDLNQTLFEKDTLSTDSVHNNILLKDEHFEVFVQAVAVCNSVQVDNFRESLSFQDIAVENLLKQLGVKISKDADYLLLANPETVQSFKVLKSQPSKSSKVRVLVENSGSFCLFVRGTKESMEGIMEEQDFGSGVPICYAAATLSRREVEQLLRDYEYAASVSFESQAKINQVFQNYERNLDFVGAVVMSAQVSEETKKTVKKMKSVGIKHVLVSSDSYENTLNAGVSSGILGTGNSLVQIENSLSPLALKTDLEELLNGLLFSEFDQGLAVGPQGFSKSFSERLSHLRDSNQLKNVYYEFMDPENKVFSARIKYDKKANVHPFLEKVLSMNESELLSFKRQYKPSNFDLVLSGEVLRHALSEENRLYLAVLFLLAESVVVGCLSNKKLVYNFIKECNSNSTVLSLCSQLESELTVGPDSEFEVRDYKALRSLIFKVGVSTFLGLKKACELYFYQSFLAFSLNSVFLFYSGPSSFTVTDLTFYDVLAFLVSMVNIGLVATADSPVHKDTKSLRFLVKALIESTLHSLLINAGLILAYTSITDSRGFTENQDLVTSSYILCFYFTTQLRILLSIPTYTLHRTLGSLSLALLVIILVFFKYGLVYSPFYVVFSSPKLALVVLTLPLVNFVLSCSFQRVSLRAPKLLQLKKSIKLYKSRFLKSKNKNIEEDYQIDKLSLSFKDPDTNRKYHNYMAKQNLRKYRMVVLSLLLLTTISQVWRLFTSEVDFYYFLVVNFIQAVVLGTLYFTKVAKNHISIVNFAFGVYCLVVIVLARNSFKEVTVTIYTLVPIMYWFEIYVSWKQAVVLNLLASVIVFVDIFSYFQEIGYEGAASVFKAIFSTFFHILITSNCGIIAYQQNYTSLKDYSLDQLAKNKAETAYNIVSFLFPEEVSLRLINGDHSISKFHDSVTIVFCNICEFDQIVNYFSPEDLTAFLDRLFTKFDRLCNTLGAFKIETVGYTFLACFGLSEPDELSAMKGIQLASWMVSEAQSIPWKQNEYIKLKIGVNTGSIISGVVGYHKPQFVLVGDTINTASRMASTLESYNSVQLSRSTFELLGDLQGYEFLEKEVLVKGKGLMQTYVLNELSGQILEVSGLKPRIEISRMTKREISSSEGDQVTKEEMRIKKIREFSPMFKTQTYNIALIVGVLEIGLLIEYFFLFNELRFIGSLIMGTLYSGYHLSFLIFKRFWENAYFAWTYQSIIPFIFIFLVMLFYSGPGNIEATCTVTNLLILFITHFSFLRFRHILITTVLINIFIVLDQTFDPVIGLFNTVLIPFFSVLCLVTLYLRDKQFEAFILSKSRLNKQLERTETLLNRVLPEHVYRGLKEDQLLTDIYPDMTILYADIVGFTSWSSQKGPEEVLSMLSKMFAKFDESCLKHNVYKVHTIGDCYVVLGSSSKVRDPVVECYNVVDFAKEMIGTIEEVNLEEGMDLSMRIGIHTGTVTAGISGTTIVRYDIYGRDVTIANKMESNGVPGKIAVSESTKQVLEAVDTPYCFEEGPLVELKEPFTTFRSYLLSY